MKRTGRELQVCQVCGKSFPVQELAPAAAVREAISREIQREHADWSATSAICHSDLNQYRARYVHSLLRTEKGELTSLEQDVLRSVRDQEVLARNVEAQFAGQWSRGEMLADLIATFGGSWTFLLCFGAFLLAWIVGNSALFTSRPADPYPFILLNLMLSCLAAVQAPIIMMSQNRQESKDRLRSQHDYQVNLKAELEIRQLHEKLDHLLLHQWQRLAEIQEIQLDLMTELGRKESLPEVGDGP